ncbi:MAG: c-type cytochrome [Magnetococcales bacterium]|nr:c-type cytochrome [Magnetococcales bacterium]
MEPITPLPSKHGQDPDIVALGERLFHDVRLSHGQQTSCASCHILEQAGVDGLAKSYGLDEYTTLFNTPTVFNSRYNLYQYWDGRAETLEGQIRMVIANPKEMDGDWNEILNILHRDPSYISQFSQSYEKGLTQESIVDALVVYIRSLITPDAPFDRYLKGDQNAITEDAKQGYALFKGYGCSACHQGVNIGGNLFQQLGVMENYFEKRGKWDQSDLGRYVHSQKDKDRFVFKVPSLRNVARTGPYLHDGSVEKLDKAIRIMGRYQLGRSLKDDEVLKIERFLESLTGSYQGVPL